MMTFPKTLFTAGAALALALAPTLVAAQSAATLPVAPLAQRPAQPMSPDTVLADNGLVKITRADYDLELTRLPPAMRGGFATNEKRVVDLINRMLVQKTLALRADQAKLLDDPEVARRLASEIERIKAQLMTAKIERDAGAAFDANPAPFEARARDLYLVDPKKFEVPAEVSASHILFATPPHSVEEAHKLAREARAAIVAGADFNAVARERSEDPSAKTNAGRLGFFKRGEMDGQFEGAAFALTKVGEISEPVETAYGVHLIRLDARKEGQRQTFEQAKPRIMAEQRQQYINAQREQALEQLRIDAFKGTDMSKVDAIVVRVDNTQVERLTREALQRQQEAMRDRLKSAPK